MSIGSINLQTTNASESLQEHLKSMRRVVESLENSLLVLGDEACTGSSLSHKSNEGAYTSYIGRRLSTMSMVHLQYKYEELLEDNESLLKLLGHRDRSLEAFLDENKRLTEDLSKLSFNLKQQEEAFKRIHSKYLRLKERQSKKILGLKQKNDLLKLAHSYSSELLNEQYDKIELTIKEHLNKALAPQRALFLQEIQHSNRLQHENLLLKQEIALLKSNLKH